MHKHIKKWGQVFLKNKSIQKRIADEVNISEYSNILEIGPGEGALTQFIDCSNREFIVVELDKKLSAYLNIKFPNIKVIQGDFLEVDVEFKNNSKALLFGNIPYYITSPIILRFISNDVFNEAILMVQKEFFESISSGVSSNRYSSFSVLLQTFLNISKVIDVGRRNFYPIPKVDSVVVKLTRKKTRLDEGDYLQKYSVFLRKSFFMPRKTLLNNWKKFLDKEQIEKIFEENNLESNVRPDEITAEKYEDIFLSSYGKTWLHNIL